MSKKQLFVINETNDELLRKYSKQEKKSMSKIINDLIYYNLKNNFENEANEIEKLENLEDSNDEKNKNILIKLSKKEYDTLKKYAKLEYISSVSRYIKFIISLKNYTQNSLYNVQIKELNETNTEIKKIGNLLNQIAKKLNQSSLNLDKIELENINENTKIILKNQAKMNDILLDFIKINKERF